MSIGYALLVAALSTLFALTCHWLLEPYSIVIRTISAGIAAGIGAYVGILIFKLSRR